MNWDIQFGFAVLVGNPVTLVLANGIMHQYPIACISGLLCISGLFFICILGCGCLFRRVVRVFLRVLGDLLGLGCFWGRFVCLMGASFVLWALGVRGAPCGFRVLGLILVGLFGFFPFVGWLW